MCISLVKALKQTPFYRKFSKLIWPRNWFPSPSLIPANGQGQAPARNGFQASLRWGTGSLCPRPLPSHQAFFLGTASQGPCFSFLLWPASQVHSFLIHVTDAAQALRACYTLRSARETFLCNRNTIPATQGHKEQVTGIKHKNINCGCPELIQDQISPRDLDIEGWVLG